MELKEGDFTHQDDYQKYRRTRMSIINLYFYHIYYLLIEVEHMSFNKTIIYRVLTYIGTSF